MSAAYASPMFKSAKHANTRRWIGILSQYVSVQLVVQALGFAVGIYVVNAFPKSEYTIYTLANGMQGMLTSLSDVGIGAGVMVIGGRVWKDKFAMGRLIRTAMSLRHLFVGMTIMVVAPIWGFIIYRHDAGLAYTLGLVAAVIMGVILQLDTLTYGAALKLNSQFKQVQNSEFQTGLLRALTILPASMFWRSSLCVIGLTAASWAWGRGLVIKWARPFFERSPVPDAEYRREIITQTRSQLPNAVFFCFQGQIQVLLLSFLGQAGNVADAGALGRLAAILMIFSSVISNVVMPSFARCHSSVLLKRRYFQIVGTFLASSTAVVLAAIMFPRLLLFVLGKKYANLENEVPWMVLSTMLMGLGGLLFGLCAAKGWTRRIWLTIPLVLLCQAGTFYLFDLSTVKGVLMFGLLPNVVYVVFYHFSAMRGMRNVETP